MDTEKQKKIFSRNLQHYIDESGMMQKDIAARLGIKTTTLNTWVKGRSLPNAAKIQNLADYFGIGKSDLLDDHNQNPDSEVFEMLTLYRQLDVEDKRETREYMRFKLQSDKYRDQIKKGIG